MPITIRKTGKGTYRVSTPTSVHAKGTTLAKAKAQERILNAVEHTNWRPTGKKKKKNKKKK